MTHDEAKLLADMIRNAREEITERQWHAIANILRKHKRTAQPPLLDDRDQEVSRVQLAQHDVAYNVLEWMKTYRERNKCKRVPSTETNKMLDHAISYAVRRYHIAPRLISRSAILTIVKNRRPSVRYPHRIPRYR